VSGVTGLPLHVLSIEDLGFGNAAMLEVPIMKKPERSEDDIASQLCILSTDRRLIHIFPLAFSAHAVQRENFQ